MKQKAILSLILSAALALAGCGTGSTAQSSEAAASSGSADGGTTLTVSGGEMFSDRDMEIGYDQETAVAITLSGDSASCDSDAVQISGSTVTITQEGVYLLSGTLDNGMVAVNTGDTEKVQLVLDGVEITNATSAAIYVAEADKVFITTAAGTENILTNGGEYVAIDDNNIDSVIFSKADLTLNGSGTLTISAGAGHGVVSKDDLVLTSGTYVISAASHGLSGKDSVRIANGTYTITSGKDGIHAENADDPELGYLYIAGGTFDITAQGDGVSGGAYLQIEDGTFQIVTGEGSASVVMPTETAGPGGRGGPQAQAQTQTTAEEETDSVSQKGIKSDGPITIAKGVFATDTADDSIHAGGDILITGGEFDLQSGDDAIHSDAAVTIQDGTVIIGYCYEGIEGLSVTIDGGTFDINSQDDGINAAGGADSSGFGGAGPQQDQFASGSDSFITINGGTFTIVSLGDCIDSNGDLTINGGVLDLTCNGSGNTALDTDGTYANNGGEVTTNDGSENNPGGMGGRGGGRGGAGGTRPTQPPEGGQPPEGVTGATPTQPDEGAQPPEAGQPAGDSQTAGASAAEASGADSL